MNVATLLAFADAVTHAIPVIPVADISPPVTQSQALAITVAILGAIPPTLFAAGGLLIAYKGLVSSNEAKASSEKNSEAIETVHQVMNSRLDQLIKEISSRARAEGFSAGTHANPGDLDTGKPGDPEELQGREETT